MRYMPVYIRHNTQIYGKYRGFGVLLGLLGGVVPLCSLCPLRVAFCVVRASFSIKSYCDCNLDIVVAWHKLAHQNPAFLVAVGRRP